MKKTIIITDEYIDVLRDGYNIVERTEYDPEIVALAQELLSKLTSEIF